MGRRRRCGGCSARRGSAASASTRVRSSRKAEWPAIITVERERRRSGRSLADPDAADEQGRSPLPARAVCCVCSHCGERLVARPRAGGQRRYACAKGRGSAAAARPTSTPTRSKRSSPRPSCTGSTRPSLPPRSTAAPSRPRRGALAGQLEADAGAARRAREAYGEQADHDGRVARGDASRSSSG